MNVFLGELGAAVPEGTHAIVVMDQAGWHVARGLTIPPNMTLVPLPPYSPELNGIERLWRYMKGIHPAWAAFRRDAEPVS
jgi:transposase